MILNNAPTNEAIVSNVGEIGEFRIRNSAKAFNILSSGLYANKIRAIIRELSCNAVDSHMAAGRAQTPFDVHLPSALEPYFSIRDYGTGLSHDQVTSIYTTYFESTKTNSNDFIGALGLGSKSPFSYTDNFTVTAVQNGRKGIYTAFINDQGVPSIALMMSEDTDEPAGVEVRFSVNDRYDYDKFQNEAKYVFTYFALRPVVSGVGNFQFNDPVYESQDIIPGVHQYKNQKGSVAIMGNIAYGIAIPDSEKSLGELRNLLMCGLEIHFNIGELDFQASREGLSYIPQTIESIKKKLIAVNAVLYGKLSNEADNISNLWERAHFLAGRKENSLWAAATLNYIQNHPIPTLVTNNSWIRLAKFELKTAELAQKFNVQLRGIRRERSMKTISAVKTVNAHGPRDANGNYQTWQEEHVLVDKDCHFVVNTLKVGAAERVKFHYRESSCDVYNRTVWILSKFDKSKDMDLNGFFAAIHNPPISQRLNVVDLLSKDRAKNTASKASILSLTQTRRGRQNAMVWSNAGTSDDFDDSKTYYYVEMNHWTPVGIPMHDIKDYHDTLYRSGIFTKDIYAVRKNDLPIIQKKSNWIELTKHVRQVLETTDMNNIMSLVKEAIDYRSVFKYTNDKLNKHGSYYKLYAEFKDVESTDSSKRHYIERLLKAYGIKINNVDPSDIIKQYQAKVDDIKNRYPMLTLLSYNARTDIVVDYINMVDKIGEQV